MGDTGITKWYTLYFICIHIIYIYIYVYRYMCIYMYIYIYVCMYMCVLYYIDLQYDWWFQPVPLSGFSLPILNGLAAALPQVWHHRMHRVAHQHHVASQWWKIHRGGTKGTGNQWLNMVKPVNQWYSWCKFEIMSSASKFDVLRQTQVSLHQPV